MHINFRIVITESEAELTRRERELRGQPNASRIRMLRLLKNGSATTLRHCADLLGYSPRQISRWWSSYNYGGLNGLLDHRPRSGRASRITPEALLALRDEVQHGRILQLEDARRYLIDEWGIAYESINGIWWILKRHGISLREKQQRFSRGA
ncbi:MAG TPA: helix-turn-helix domain-containing protein [Roseiflexaceae bacterium]|nr:helix-turn-helix domain-containing protein [Roseiflexaceae bacterium]